MTGGAGSRARAAAAAVASLPAMTPQRLAKLRRAGGERGPEGSGVEDWEGVLEDLRRGGDRALRLARAALGDGQDAGAGGSWQRLARRWSAAARVVDPASVAAACDAAGVRVLLPGDGDYPPALVYDPEAPAVLFCCGAAGSPGSCAVAVVGTRSATHYGKEVAAELGAVLASHGVSVVSGLAAGIDAAAHEGALAPSGVEGCPVAVVGAGLDVAYPAATARLRRRVEASGAVLSEAPLGAPPEPWRFPLRNRIIAALSRLVVVVESHRAGGALHTVEAALARGIEVMAVPGSIRSPASAGTNWLIASGAQVVTSPDDVFVALGRSVAASLAPTLGSAAPVRVELTPADRAVLAAVEPTPVSTQEILERTERPLGEVALALDRLEAAGLVRDCGGAWVLQARRARGRGG